MTEKSSDDTQRIYRRVRGELLDDFDEEIEMELDDERMDRLVGDIDASSGSRRGSTAGSISVSSSACRPSW
jgi:hypothetical protein